MPRDDMVDPFNQPAPAPAGDAPPVAPHVEFETENVAPAPSSEDVPVSEARSARAKRTEPSSARSTVNAGKVPGKVRVVELRGGETVQDVFGKIQVSTMNCELMRNGAKAELGDKVQAGDTVLAVAKIRGN